MTEIRHVPVLLDETIDGLDIHSGDVVVDGTLGSGGHSLEILKRVLPDGVVISMDMDGDAIRRFQERLTGIEWAKKALDEGKIKLFQKNFAELESVLDEVGVECISGIMVDLGFSSDQMDIAERGLSFSKEGPLDMRLDREYSDVTAEKIVMEYSGDELERILREYGEERFAKSIAKAIVCEREKYPIRTTKVLASIAEKAIPQRYRSGKIHSATKTFQALRMEVNHELESLRLFLPQAIRRLKSGGRLAVIAFHSGEDRIVKQVFRENARGCICPPAFPICRCDKHPVVQIVTAKPVVPSMSEVNVNPRARSAKLRIIGKL